MKRGFSMIEILVSLVFVSFAFLPIYNLFSFGQRGTTSNEKEIEATNYASDLINFCREQTATDFDRLFQRKKWPLVDDDAIHAMFKKINLQPPPKVKDGYTRSMEVCPFEGRNTSGVWGIPGAISDFFKNRQKVPNYRVTVEVKFPKVGSKKVMDNVTLITIVLD